MSVIDKAIQHFSSQDTKTIEDIGSGIYVEFKYVENGILTKVHKHRTKNTRVIFSTAYTNKEFTVIATFSENVTNFDLNDFSLTNSTASNFVSISAKEYSATIIPSSDGEVSVNINASIAEDIAANNNTASTNQIKTFYDGTIPTVTLISSVPSDTNINNFNVTIMFSEDITGFDINDISLVNATLSNFTTVNSKEYSTTITSVSEGDITVDVLANTVEDIANNKNSASNQIKTNYDNTKPSLSISTSASNPINTEFTALFTFSEDVFGFDINERVKDKWSLSILRQKRNEENTRI